MIVVASLEAWLSVADTIDALFAPLSSITAGVSASVATGVSSSSSMVSVTASGSRARFSLDTAPDTVTVRSGASTASSTAVMVTVPALRVAPAATVSVRFSLRRKCAAPSAPAADTVTVVATVTVRTSTAVTVADPPFSEIDALDSDSVTVGSGSCGASSSSSAFVPDTIALRPL